MDEKLLRSITSQIYRQFPEIEGATPKVSLQPSYQAKSSSSSASFLITYRRSVKSSSGKSISRIVRVTADSHGRILKVTTSR